MQIQLRISDNPTNHYAARRIEELESQLSMQETDEQQQRITELEAELARRLAQSRKTQNPKLNMSGLGMKASEFNQPNK